MHCIVLYCIGTMKGRGREPAAYVCKLNEQIFSNSLLQNVVKKLNLTTEVDIKDFLLLCLV